MYVNVNNQSLPEAAENYASQGVKIFPLVAGSKTPIYKNSFHDATCDLSVINGNWSRNMDANIGYATGQINGVFVLDIDVKNGKNGEESLVELQREHGELPETLVQKTPSGGRHLFYKVECDVRTRTNISDGIDVRGNGGYVVIAPSVTDEGQYTFINNIEIADAPAWLVDWINTSALKRSDSVSEGERNSHIFRKAVECRKNNVSYKEAAVVVSEANQQCSPQLEDNEVQRTLDSAYRYQPGHEVPKEIMEMNQRFAVVSVGGKCRVLEEKTDPLFGNKDFDLWQVTDFKQYFSNRYVEINGKHKKLGSAWFEHAHRREYAGIGFYPKGAPNNIYNMWGGFAVEPVDGDCSLYLKHIKDNIASGDECIYNYIVAWMADVVQNPDKLIGISLVLRGNQGVGKGIFANEFGALFGKHYISLCQSNQLIGRFNGHFKDKVLLLADEAFWGGDKQAEGTLKSMVTEPYITVEEKGLNAVTMKNHLHMIFSTNNDWAVPAGPQERRFFVLDVGDKQMQNTGYFKAISEQMDNGGREALLYYLLNYDLTGINLRTFPQTEALWEQKLKSMTPVQKFWLHKLETGQLDMRFTDEFGRPNIREGWGHGEIECERLFRQYKEFVSDLGVRHKATNSELGSDLRKLLPGNKDHKARPTIDGSRRYVYRFPELDKCREHFCTIMNYEIEWPVEEADEE